MKLNDDGTIDYGLDDYTTPAPRQPRNQPGQINDNDPAFGGGSTNNDTVIDNPNQNPGYENNPVTQPAPTQPGGAPSGGSINDPAYLDSLISYYGSQPGVNPSVKNDPNYWKQAVASGRFNGDEGYLIQRFFQPEGPPEGAGASSGGGGISTGAQQPLLGGGNSGLTDFLTQLLQQNAANTSTTNAQRQSVLTRLSALADQYGQPVTADDPNIKGSTDAYTGQVNRSVNAFKKQAAERALAEGVPTGAFDAQVGNATMAGGRAIGDNETQLMHDEMLSRRQSLMDVLGQSGSLLSAQDSADINSRIASIDAVLKSKGIDVTAALGKGGLDLQGQSLNLQGELGNRSLANSETATANQNSQFYDQFGADQANKGTSLDDILASLLLGGS